MKLTKFQQRLIDYIQKYQPCKIPVKSDSNNEIFKKEFKINSVPGSKYNQLMQLLNNKIIKKERMNTTGRPFLYSINPDYKPLQIDYKEPEIEEDPLFKALTKFIAGMIIEKTEKYKNIITGLQEQLCKNPLTEKNEMLYVETITNMQKQLNNANYEIAQLKAELRDAKRRKDPTLEECFPEEAKKLRELERLMKKKPRENKGSCPVKTGKINKSALKSFGNLQNPY